VHDVDVISGEDFFCTGRALGAEPLRKALTTLRCTAADRGELAAGSVDGVGMHRADHAGADDRAAWRMWLAHRRSPFQAGVALARLAGLDQHP
jgi:hypothetical protein